MLSRSLTEVGLRPAFFCFVSRGVVDEWQRRNGVRVNRLELLSTTIEPTMTAMGYSLVRLQVTGQRTLRVQIMAERDDARPLTIDDCAMLSRSLSAKLDEADLIATPYTLEVSSPGIDRPLVKLMDFERFAGNLARVDLHEPMEGRRRFTGRLLGVDGTDVRIEVDSAEARLPFERIGRAKLLMDDALLARDSLSDEPGRSSEAD